MLAFLGAVTLALCAATSEVVCGDVQRTELKRTGAAVSGIVKGTMLGVIEIWQMLQYVTSKQSQCEAHCPISMNCSFVLSCTMPQLNNCTAHVLLLELHGK